MITFVRNVKDWNIDEFDVNLQRLARPKILCFAHMYRFKEDRK